MQLIRWLDKIWSIGLMVLFFFAPIIMIRGPEGGFNNLVLKETFCQAFILFFLFTVIAKKLMEKKLTFTRLPVDFLLIALLLLAGFSIFYSPTVYTSAQEFSKFALFIIFYFLVIDQIQDRKTMALLFIPIIASAVITAFFATCQNQQFYLWGFLPRAEDRNRMMATMGHNNGVASYLMMTGFILFGWLLHAKREKSKNFWVAVLLIWFLFVIVATLSRGVWMGTFTGLIIFSYFLIRRLGFKNVWKQYKKPIIIAIIILALFTIILSFKNPLNPWNISVVKRISETWFRWESYVSDTRIRMWTTTWEMIREHPIRGVGLGAFKYLVPLYQGKFFERYPDTRLEPTSALTNQSHNEYLQLWAELGIFGLLVGLIALIIYLRSGWKTIKRMRELEQKHQDSPVSYATLFAGLYAGSIGILVQSLVDFPLHIAPLALLFLLMVALVMNAKRIIAVKLIPEISDQRFQRPRSKSGQDLILTPKIFGVRNLLCIISVIIFYIITLVPLSIILLSNKEQQKCGFYLTQASRHENEPDRIRLLKQAIDAGNKSVALQPSSGRAQYYLGLAYLRFGDLHNGIEHLNLAQKDLEYRDLHYELGLAYERLKLYPAAITEYKKTVYIYPPSTDALDRLSRIYEIMGYTADQFAAWNKIIKYNPNYMNETIVNKGYEYRIAKKWDLAQQLYEWGISVDSTNLAMWRGLIGLYHASKQYDKLISACLRLIELSPNEPNAYQRLAIGYLAQGKFPDAKQNAEKALQLDPNLTLSKRIIREADKKNAVRL
ncbi:MAG: O-antigen ligase family protein [bacterium]|nr:O-antigen ligase family protein [bacterium]